jgi:hypothetical protein
MISWSDNGVSASLRGESLKVAISAIDALAAANSAAARATLLKYARIQVTIVRECADDPRCRQHTMSPLPDDALVERAPANRVISNTVPDACQRPDTEVSAGP